ncbi:hypothetical protein Ndes2526B_g00286 [Nannochloris sp. 'desiccata']
MVAGVQALGGSRQGCFSNRIIGGSSFTSSPLAALPIFSSHPRSPARPTLTVSAAPNDKEDAATDWDTAWSTFRKGVEAQSPKSNVGTKPPKFSNGTSNWNAGPTQNQIRKQERTLLDIWTKESFFSTVYCSCSAVVHSPGGSWRGDAS